MFLKTKLLLCCALISSFIPYSSAEQVEVSILATSDVHGRMVPWDYGTDTENFSGSYSQISSFINHYKVDHPNVIVVDAGDIIQDNQIELFYNVDKHPAIEALNAMHYDVIALGNHEFNFGIPALNHILAGFKGQVLAANIYYKADGKRYFPAATIIEQSGIKIGIIGVTTPFVPEFEAKTGHVDHMLFTMPIPEIKAQVEQLQKQSVDAIVLVAHMGLENENNKPGTGVADIAQQVNGIDVIIAGHNHQNISQEIINNTVITEPHRYGTVVSVINLTFDVKQGQVSLINKQSTTQSVQSYSADPQIVKIYEPYHNKLRSIANEIIGKTDQDLVPHSAVKGLPAVYMVDTGLTALFNNAQLYYSDADVVSILINNQNVMLDKGNITRKDIANSYQYTAGETSIYPISGKDLKDYMEWSAGYFAQLSPGDTQYHYDPIRRASKYMTYDMFGGVKYHIDLREPVGQRIKHLTLTDGTVITEDMTIKMGMNAYRYEMLVKEGGPLAGRRIEPIWNSRTAFGSEAGKIRNMVIKYIVEAKHGDITDESKHNWQVVGIDDK